MLCLTKETDELFMASLETLMKSNSSDFMVYKVFDNKFENLPGLEEWANVIEIDLETFTQLHLNLCYKVGKEVRKR